MVLCGAMTLDIAISNLSLFERKHKGEGVGTKRSRLLEFFEAIFLRSKFRCCTVVLAICVSQVITLGVLSLSYSL